VKTLCQPQKPEVYNIVVSQATTTANMYRNFVKFGCVVFEICERTDRHGDTLIALLRIPTMAEIIKKLIV